MDFNNFIKQIMQDDHELEKEMELLGFKYLLIGILVAYRRTNNLSQKDFAKKTNTNKAFISSFEKGEVDPPFSMVIRILDAMDRKIQFVEKNQGVVK